MSNTIWKSVLRVMQAQDIEVPVGAIFLCAREQVDDVCVWFRCDPDAAKTKRTIYICGTGHEAPVIQNANYLGTAVVHGGALVWHVFEKI